MMRSAVLLLVVAVVAAVAGGVTEGAVVGGLERVGDRIWTTSGGVTVVCGGRRSSSDRQASPIEAQLTAVLDSACRYLVNEPTTTSAVDDLQASQQDAPQVTAAAQQSSIVQ